MQQNITLGALSQVINVKFSSIKMQNKCTRFSLYLCNFQKLKTILKYLEKKDTNVRSNYFEMITLRNVFIKICADISIWGKTRIY